MLKHDKKLLLTIIQDGGFKEQIAIIILLVIGTVSDFLKIKIVQFDWCVLK